MATKLSKKTSGSITDNTVKDQEILRLKDELKNMQQLFQQLTEEKKEESYDVRRTYMLKAQILQLERQCLLLSEALSSRSLTIKEIENELISHTEKFQELLATNGPNVVISKSEVVSFIQNMQRFKGILHKQDTLSHPENLTIPQLSGLKYAKPGIPVTCLDVCDGNLKHINLKHVGSLENKLISLYKDLENLQGQLSTLTCKTNNNMPERYLFSDSFKNFQTTADSCSENLQNCCQDLLSVSLLHPTAPWSVITKHEEFDLFNQNKILSKLPPVIRSKPEIKSILYSLCKAHNYTTQMHKLKIQILNKNLDQNSKINKTQAHYMNCLIAGITQAYNECEENILKSISEPIGEIVDSWENLKKKDNEKTLKEFLTIFKQKENILQNFADPKSSSQQSQTEDNPFLQFALDLENSIKTIQLNCLKKCQKLNAETDELNVNMTKAENEVQHFLSND